jgi:hypothetical protein
MIHQGSDLHEAVGVFKDGPMIERFKLYLRITLLLIGVAFVAEAQADKFSDSVQKIEDN